MTLRIFWLTSRPSRQGLSTLLLPAVAFALVGLLLSVVIGGAQTFWTWEAYPGTVYQLLAVIAIALLVVPLLSLGAAAARLSARRRDDRLATLRLIGATARTTAALTILESGLVAFAGSLVGILLGYAVSPLVGRIRFRDEALGTDGVMLPVWVAAAVLAALVLVAVGSSLVSLQRVIVTPLGVVLNQEAPRIGAKGILVGIGGILLASFLLGNMTAFGSMLAVIIGFGLAFGIAVLVLDAVGPWLTAVVARRKLARSERPADMLAARNLLESPRAAWRQISGVAMSSFVAVVAGAGLALIKVLERENLGADDAMLVADIRTGVLITVIGTFLMVACTVGVNQAAQILDRRDVLRSLHLVGAPLAVQDAARRKAVLSPLLLASLGSVLVAAVVMFPLVGTALLIAPLTLGAISGSVLLGIALVLLSLLATRPLLRSTATTVGD